MDGLAEGAALADHHDISFLHRESGRAVYGDVPVPLLVSIIFGDVVQVIPSDDNGPLHFG